MTATLPATSTTPTRKLHQLVPRLNRQSLEKRHDAYQDIDWDAPDLAIGPDDPRVGLFEFDPLRATAWYQAQPASVQQTIGLHRVCAAFKVGMQFENLLQRGLLTYACRLPNGAPEFRYVHHEIIEESQHSLMFQELVNRSGMPVKGMPLRLRLIAPPAVAVIERFAPALFFMLVLGGEDPVDHLQRQQLRRGGAHPLVEAIMRIHVTEEARHIAFARTYLKDLVPQLSPVRRWLLGISTAVVQGIMTPLMVDPTPELHHCHGVPREVLREARRSPEAAQIRKDSVAKLRRFSRDLGLMHPLARLTWRLVGLWDADGHPRAAKRAAATSVASPGSPSPEPDLLAEALAV